MADPLAAPSPLPAFRFQPRRGKLDWRTLSAIDLDRVQREVDIDTLERHLGGVAFADVSQNDLHWFSEADFMQLFRLLQLVTEYLLYVQETLHRRNVVLEGALSEAQVQLRDPAEYIGLLEAQLRGMAGGVGLPAKPPVGPAGLAVAHKCQVCHKAFATEAYLQAHIRRRHPGHTQISMPADAATGASGGLLMSLASSSGVGGGVAAAGSGGGFGACYTQLAALHAAAGQPPPPPPVARPPTMASEPAPAGIPLAGLPSGPAAADSGGAAVGLSRAQVDLAVSSAVEDVKESLRDDLNQELRASLELEIGDSLRESVASSVKAEIGPLLQQRQLAAEGAGGGSGSAGGGGEVLLSAELKEELSLQTSALKEQMDRLQDEVASQRMQLEAREAAVAPAEAASGAAAVEAAREAAHEAAAEAARDAAAEAAREAALEAATSAAQVRDAARAAG